MKVSIEILPHKDHLKLNDFRITVEKDDVSSFGVNFFCPITLKEKAFLERFGERFLCSAIKQLITSATYGEIK